MRITSSRPLLFKMDFISSCGVYTAYRYILLCALGLPDSRKFNTFRTRAFRFVAVSGSRTPSAAKYNPFESCTALPSLSTRVLPTSYSTPPDSKANATFPLVFPLDSRPSALTAPTPNRANSIAMSMVVLPDPTSPSSSVYPVGNSRCSSP